MMTFPAAFPAAFPDGMSADHPYGPVQALLDGLPWLIVCLFLGWLIVVPMALFEVLRPLRRALDGELRAQWDEIWRERIRHVARFFALLCVIPVAISGVAAVRMLPADEVTSRTWSYEGDAHVIEASSGRQSWVKLGLASGHEVLLKGISSFELNEEFDSVPWGVSLPVTVRCQAWHRWFLGEGDYVSAWCENPRFGED